MKKPVYYNYLVFLACYLVSCTPGGNRDNEAYEAVATAIRSNIGWALTKDTALMYSTLAHDDQLLIINPDSSMVEGIDALRKVAESEWLDPRFKATSFEVRDLRITFSRSGSVAWFFCRLDDFGEWDGRRIGWKNVRWTGVLEHMDGRWQFRQMHFSFPKP
ncbi:MAG: nuclear transport factor 2 family protein [Bacteroidales bacterium]|nr:nuclear transport factor 2 family protein [Bacteroidales bacterium]